MRFLMIIYFVCAIACTDSLHGENKSIDTGYTLIDSSMVEKSGLTEREYFIKTFSDSIDMLTEGSQLPKFLSEPQFDYEKSGILAPFHQYLPLRKAIIDSVTNCNALLIISKSTDHRIKDKPKLPKGVSVEYSDKSFYELVQSRIDELNCKIAHDR